MVMNSLNKNIKDKSTDYQYQELSNKNKVIKKYEPKKIMGSIIGKLVSSHYYVSKDVMINDLADAFIKNEDIPSVGVIDENTNEAIGIIVKKSLFDTLSRPYGRDVYKYKAVETLTEKVESFNYEYNIFTVAEHISNNLYNQENKFYLLKSIDNQFAGVFSTFDMLVYLSQITQRDINLAQKLQSGIVQDFYYESNEYVDIAGFSKMAKGIGGDFYHFKKYNDNRWIIMIFDVSGKGISASLLSTTISGMLSIYDLNRGIGLFISKLNEYLFNTFESEKFVTGIIIDYDEKKNFAKIFDLGHSHIYLFNKKISRVKVSTSELPLGITPTLEPKPSKLKLEKGDMLIALTDGIIEQTNTDGKEYDMKRLVEVIIHMKSRGFKAIKDEIVSDIKRFRGNQPQHDDMTLVLMNANQ